MSVTQCCPRHPGRDPSLPHQIILYSAASSGHRTRLTCNCGADLGTWAAGDLAGMLAAYRTHEEAQGDA